MSARRLIATLPAALLAGLGLATPAAAHASIQSAATTVYGPTFDRIWASVAALLAIAAVITGRMALTRSARRIGDGGRRGSIVALVAGLIALVNGGLVLATADGGPGTGNGVVAGAAALLLGLIAVVLGGLARSRSLRTS